jgi:hypothetical protein
MVVVVEVTLMGKILVVLDLYRQLQLDSELLAHQFMLVGIVEEIIMEELTGITLAQVAVELAEMVEIDLALQM